MANKIFPFEKQQGGGFGLPSIPGLKPMFEGAPGNYPLQYSSGGGVIGGGGIRPISELQYSDPQGRVFAYRSPLGTYTAAPTSYLEQISGPDMAGGTSETPESILTSGKYRDLGFAGMNPGETLPSFAPRTPEYNPASGPIINFGGGAQALGKNPTIDTVRDYLAKGSDPANHADIPTSSGSKTASDIAAITANPPVAGNPPFGGLTPTPPTFDAAAEEARLMSSYGLDGLNSQLSSLDSQISGVQNDLMKTILDITTKGGVSSRFLGKESSVATKAANQQLRELRAARIELTRQITAANKSISMIMSAEKTDYQNAKSIWEFEYNKNQQYVNSLDKTATQEQKQEKANLQTMLKAINPGQELSAEDKNNLDEAVIKTYNPSFLGIENTGLKSMVYSWKVPGKNVVGTLNVGDNGYEIKFITPEHITAAKKTTTDYRSRLNKEVANLYSGRYGTQGAREEVINMLKNEFPGIDVAKDIYNRVPDNFEESMKRITSSNAPSKTTQSLSEDIVSGATVKQLYSAYPELSPSFINSVYNEFLNTGQIKAK